jgi:hypothetical protein
MLVRIEVEVEHRAGKFAGKDAIFEVLAELIGEGEIVVDEATYDVVSVEMGAEPATKSKKEARNAGRA